ncbi:DUF6263 family protein [Carboxylicivirga linearis]|uniref:Histidine kinase n=1 Tax=Carboxylicivirga linearis TaxID=1628157 RepID=A0ABS5K102_9BACT|nr:DUF6263 family protein [Carboxylicivirga linearis]MBS2100226.1 histidine kinase [Carboxylicivirga linearis]
MKKLLFLIYLIAHFAISQANNSKSLKYDFNIGDEFVVKVRSYGLVHNKLSMQSVIYVNELNPTSIDFYFLFQPLSNSRGVTKMKVDIHRVVRWHNNRCYDTQIPNYAIDSYENIFKELVNKSFTITLDQQGKVLTVKGIEGIYEDILNKKFSDSFNQFYNTSFRSAFSAVEFKKVIQNIFPRLDLASNVLKVTDASDLLNVIYKATTSPYKYDICILNNGDMEQYLPFKADTLLFSKSKGRFVKGEIKSNKEFYDDDEPNGVTGYNNFSNVFGRVASFVNYGVEDNRSNRVVLKGVIKGNTATTGSLYVKQRYPDYESFQKQEFMIEKDGTFELTFDLHRPMDLTFRVGAITSDLTFAKDIFLEPGDELEININNQTENPEWSFGGKSTLKFNLLDNINSQIKPYTVTEGENVDSLIQKMWDQVHLLEQQIKDKPLTTWAKKYIKTNLFVNINYSMKGSNYVSRNLIKDLKELHVKWMEEMESALYIYPETNKTRAFIDTYIKIKSDDLQRYRWKNNGTEVQYNLAKVLLEGEVLYYSEGKYLNEAIQKADLELAEKMLIEFQEKFPSTELANTFKRQLGDYSVMKEGKPAPDFTLPNMDGKNISLSDYQGQWVYVVFKKVQDDVNNANLRFLQLLNDSVQGPFKTLLVVTDKTANYKLISEIRKFYTGDLLLNPEWSNSETLNYKATKSNSAFLINSKGEFELLWDQHLNYDMGLGNGRFFQYANVLSEYIHLKQPEFSKSKIQKSYIYGSLAVIMLISALVWFYFKMRQKQFEKEEARKREKVQLELKAIRSQLNPHFMFNTLNSIQHLVSDDRNEEACLYISEFSGLMRQVLNDSNKILIPLASEIEALQTYLKLEALRFGFDYHLEVDPNLETDLIEIPGLMVQPFVENAVIHGVSKLKEKGRIRISFQLHNNKLLCCVDDNGGGYSEVKNTLLNGQGIALSKRRLEVMKESYQLEIGLDIKNKGEADPAKNGTLVEITYELNDV